MTRTAVGKRAHDLDPVPAGHVFGHFAGDHDWRVHRDWHRPRGHASEWRLHVCGGKVTVDGVEQPCPASWTETREPTGLVDEDPEFETLADLASPSEADAAG